MVLVVIKLLVLWFPRTRTAARSRSLRRPSWFILLVAMAVVCVCIYIYIYMWYSLLSTRCVCASVAISCEVFGRPSWQRPCRPSAPQRRAESRGRLSTRGLERARSRERNTAEPVVTYDPHSLGPPLAPQRRAESRGRFSRRPPWLPNTCVYIYIYILFLHIFIYIYICV